MLSQYDNVTIARSGKHGVIVDIDLDEHGDVIQYLVEVFSDDSNSIEFASPQDVELSV